MSCGLCFWDNIGHSSYPPSRGACGGNNGLLSALLMESWYHFETWRKFFCWVSSSLMRWSSSLWRGQHVAPCKYYITNCFALWRSGKGHRVILHCVLPASLAFLCFFSPEWLRERWPRVQVLACFSGIYLRQPCPDFSTLRRGCVRVSVGWTLHRLKTQAIWKVNVTNLSVEWTLCVCVCEGGYVFG